MQVLFSNSDIIAINKPHGLLVHKSPIAKDVKEFALQKVRVICGHHVYPIHRLDRKTSGVLAFAKSKEVQSMMNASFQSREPSKEYIAIVRGYFPDELSVDYPLTNDKGIRQDAQTLFTLISTSEIPVSHLQHATCRYSLIKCAPSTGRMHQIRKHLAHVRHPILGDRPHGCNKQNRLWKQRYNMNCMMLHARGLELHLPNGEQERIRLYAPTSGEFSATSRLLGWQDKIEELNHGLSK